MHEVKRTKKERRRRKKRNNKAQIWCIITSTLLPTFSLSISDLSVMAGVLSGIRKLNWLVSRRGSVCVWCQIMRAEESEERVIKAEPLIILSGSTVVPKPPWLTDGDFSRRRKQE